MNAPSLRDYGHHTRRGILPCRSGALYLKSLPRHPTVAHTTKMVDIPPPGSCKGGENFRWDIQSEQPSEKEELLRNRQDALQYFLPQRLPAGIRNDLLRAELAASRASLPSASAGERRV